MFTIRETVFIETVEKRSKFLSCLVPYSLFETELQRLRDEHPKANHIVHAFRYINEYQQAVEGSSDDGEPRGCAGIPTLNVLRGAELVECALLTVRYFGGIKLGTGGMARAYGSAARAAVESATLIPYRKERTFTFRSPYLHQRQIDYRLKELGIRVLDRNFDSVEFGYTILGTGEQIDAFLSETGRLVRPVKQR